MKDLEKIKSEDLGCQVADANPGNFAIEQEVAALVGATLPAPTEPSADDASELGAQLLVFLRRALLPIQTALRTALAAIYAHLDSRCTDYTPAAYAPFQDPATMPPYDPMRPLTPRTLPNLLTALTAFSDRKISNGSAPSDGIPDGISLAHLLCSANQATKIMDDNPPYATINQLFPIDCFPHVNEITLNGIYISSIIFNATNRAIVVYLPYSKGIASICCFGSGAPNVEVHNAIETLPTEIGYANYTTPYFRCGKVYWENLKRGSIRNGGDGGNKNVTTTYMYLGCMGIGNSDKIGFYGVTSSLTDLEVREGARQALDLSYRRSATESDNCALPGLTAENIVNHIFDKLADNTGNAPITLNLCSDLLNKLTAEQKAIAQNKNYTLA